MGISSSSGRARRRSAGGRWLRAVVFAMAALVLGAPAHADSATAVFRTLPPPKVLYIADGGNSQLWAERLKLETGAAVTFVPLGYGDLEFHHLCDKPLEESKEDVAYVQAEGRKFAEAQAARLKEFNVVIAQIRPGGDAWALELQKKLVAYAQAGGNLVVINPSWETVFENTPLAEVVPVKFDGRKTWTTACQGATDHPLTRGLPFEVTGYHWYGPVYAPADASCVPLTVNKDMARYWYRKLPGSGGQVVHLFNMDGSRWQWSGGTNYATYEGERPDDAEVWTAFHQRLLYWLTYGDRAFPVTVRFVLPPKSVYRGGQALAVPVELENRTDQPQKVMVQVGGAVLRRPHWVVASGADVNLQPGEKRTVTAKIAGALSATEPWVRLEAVVTPQPAGASDKPDVPGLPVFSQAIAWVPFLHPVPLTLSTDRAAYRAGAPIAAKVAWQNAAAGAYRLLCVLVDRNGRALARSEQKLAVSAETPGSASATLTMPDGGPECLSSCWVTAFAYDKQDIVVGSARVQVQLDEPWHMRKQMQWSLWAWGWNDLFTDAGFNAIGMGGSSPAADRYGLHQYVESTGINTFGVTIDYDNWPAVRADMEKQMAAQEKNGPDARSKSVVSLGEESGFKGGWGTRYYWPEDKAPALVQKVFAEYLTELYAGNLETLNAEWGTAYKAFTEVPLEKAKVRAPGQVFIAAQAWEAAQKQGKTDTIPVDLQKVDPARKYLALTAPYLETYAFFDWYYQKYCDLATEVYHAQRNPVPRTIMSAPGGFYPKVDVFNFDGQGPFYPKEGGLVGNAAARRLYGDEPGFSGAMWVYFDLYPLWSCTILSSLLAGNTHLDYWVDVPLTFNADNTHTRASFWTKLLTRQVRPLEPVLLHKRVAYTPGLGLYIPRQPVAKGVLGQHFGSAVNGNAPLYSALEESGLMPKVVSPAELQGIRVLVASHAQVVSAEDGRQLAEFVRAGGTLIATPWLAAASPHGNLLSVYPSAESGLAALLGFKLLNTSQTPLVEAVTATLPGNLQPLALTSKGRDRVMEPLAADVTVAARYKDGTPLLLMRSVGKGRVVYLNMIYDWDGWWMSFHEPARESYRKLIAGLATDYGTVRPEYFIGFGSARATDESKGWWGMVMKSQPQPGESVPWWASQLYSDPSGKVRYLAVFADHRSPVITATVRWNAPIGAIHDLFTGAALPVKDGMAELTLRPGGAALWAITPGPAPEMKLSLPWRVRAGAPLTVGLRGRKAGPGDYGAIIDVFGPDGKRRPALSPATVNVPGGGSVDVVIPTAANDALGEYRVVVTNSLTRQETASTFRLTATAATPEPFLLTPFPPVLATPAPALTMSDAEFLGELRRLRELYTGSFTGLEAKYALSYYLNVPFRPDNRHAILRRLQRVDWQPHLAAVAAAMRQGETFILCGEDLNVDPLSGVAIDPFAKSSPTAFVAALAKMPGAVERPSVTSILRLRIIRVGAGRFIVADTSVDRAAYHSSDFVAWHATLKAALAAAGTGGKE